MAPEISRITWQAATPGTRDVWFYLLAALCGIGTGWADVSINDLLFTALLDMFEHDRSAARGEMTTRKLIVFRHASALGSARTQDLFGRATVLRKWRGDEYEIGDPRLDNAPPARAFSDYRIVVNRNDPAAGIEIIEL